MNKNISVWRGNTAPPTNYHLWYNENDDQLYIQKGTDDWSIIIESEETRKANEIIREKNEKTRQEQEDAREQANNYALTVFSNKQTEFEGQEQARVDAETKREQDCKIAISNAKAATAGAEKVNAIIDGSTIQVTDRNGNVSTYDMYLSAEDVELTDYDNVFTDWDIINSLCNQINDCKKGESTTETVLNLIEQINN